MNAGHRIAGWPADLLRGSSFEITGKDLDTLDEAAPFLEPGTHISITSLPGEKAAERIEAARRLRALGLVPVPHIAARRIESEGALDTFLDGLAETAACDRVFIIAGDMAEPIGPYPDAISVIRSGRLEKFGISAVGIAGYPDGHPAIDQQTCWQALLDKVSALGDLGVDCEIVTQFTFDAQTVLDWLEQLRERGVAQRVRVGLPGPANVRTLLRFAAHCGVRTSARTMGKYGLSITRLLDTAGPDSFIREFSANLLPGVHGEARFHLYPFGGLKKTAAWHASRLRVESRHSSDGRVQK